MAVIHWTEEQKVALVERRQFGPATTTHVVGVVQQRDCGCTLEVGYRLDTNEPTFGISHCPDHERAASQAMLSFGALPPTDRPVLELFRELLDAAITTTPMTTKVTG